MVDAKRPGTNPAGSFLPSRDRRSGATTARRSRTTEARRSCSRRGQRDVMAPTKPVMAAAGSACAHAMPRKRGSLPIVRSSRKPRAGGRIECQSCSPTRSFGQVYFHFRCRPACAIRRSKRRNEADDTHDAARCRGRDAGSFAAAVSAGATHSHRPIRSEAREAAAERGAPGA